MLRCHIECPKHAQFTNSIGNGQGVNKKPQMSICQSALKSLATASTEAYATVIPVLMTQKGPETLAVDSSGQLNISRVPLVPYRCQDENGNYRGFFALNLSKSSKLQSGAAASPGSSSQSKKMLMYVGIGAAVLIVIIVYMLMMKKKQ